MYDAIVVGARCAGAPVAMLLARRGYKVLLVDRNRFPSEIPHGHFIHKHGPVLLKRWGLLDRVARSGCPAVRSFSMDFGDFPLVGTDLELDGVPLGYGPRRRILDNLLVEAACEAGVEFRPNYTVERYLAEGEIITGIRGSNKQASGGEERAAITIGADGRNSLLARTVGAPAYNEGGVLACWYFSYWADVECGDLQMYLRGNRAIFAFRTNDNLLTVFVGCPAGEFAQAKLDIDSHFREAFRMVPELEERISAGRRVERYYGTGDLPNFFRKPYGGGWALAGDAGYHKDPFLALGICDAFRDAELLSGAIDSGLSGRRPMQEALADYQAKRDAAAMPEYQENLRFAALSGIPEEVLQLRRVLRENPAETRRFMLAREGRIPLEEFFNAEHMTMLMSRLSSAATQ